MAYGDPQWTYNTGYNSTSNIRVTMTASTNISSPNEGDQIHTADGETLRYTNKKWVKLSVQRDPYLPLTGLEFNAAEADVKTVKHEIWQRIMWLEGLMDRLTGDKKEIADDAIHYLRTALGELSKLESLQT